MGSALPGMPLSDGISILHCTLAHSCPSFASVCGVLNALGSRLKRHTSAVWGLDFTACGTRLVSAAVAFGMLAMVTWDWQNGKACHAVRVQDSIAGGTTAADCSVVCSPCRGMCAVSISESMHLFSTIFAPPRHGQ